MMNVRLTNKQIQYLKNKLLPGAKEYAALGHELAMKDVEAIQDAINGIATIQLAQMLRYNIEQIEADALWKLNSTYHVEMMTSILNNLPKFDTPSES